MILFKNSFEDSVAGLFYHYLKRADGYGGYQVWPSGASGHGPTVFFACWDCSLSEGPFPRKRELVGRNYPYPYPLN